MTCECAVVLQELARDGISALKGVDSAKIETLAHATQDMGFVFFVAAAKKTVESTEYEDGECDMYVGGEWFDATGAEYPLGNNISVSLEEHFPSSINWI